MANAQRSSDACIDGIPHSIVRLNRITIVTGVVLALITQQPLILTVLFLIIAPAALFGRRASLIYQIGTRVLAKQIANEPKEDKATQRFNNIIAAVFLLIANVAFLLNVPTVGWIFAIGVAAAATVALLGFCVGCFLYYQFKLGKYRLFKALN